MNLTERIAELQADVARARREHFKLVWVAGGTAPARSILLRGLADAEDGICVEVGRILSEALIEIPAPLRTASMDQCFAGCIAAPSGALTCLDHLEILFEPSLKINPVQLVRSASRHALLVASWPGRAESNRLVFGPPDHPARTQVAHRDLESILHIL